MRRFRIFSLRSKIPGPAGRLMPTPSLRSSNHTGEASFPLDHVGYSGRAVECAVSRPNTHYRLPLPLEYIFPLPARSPRRVGHSLRSTASLAASETIGDDFFEGLKEVAGTQARSPASVPAGDLRNDLRQNRTNLLTLCAFPHAPALAPIGPRRQKCQNRRRKVEKPAVPRQNPVKKRRKVEKPTDPRQKP